MAKEAASTPEEKKKINRREFLNLAFMASLGVLTLDVAAATYFFAMPTFEEGEFGGVVTFGRVADLPATDAPPINLPKVKTWISNTEDGVLGIYKVCTHLGCLYNWADQDDRFKCPCHGSNFAKTGDYIRGPAPRSLDRFVLRIVDPNTGEVLAESTDGSPLPVPDNPDALIQIDTGKRIQGAPKSESPALELG
jgi:cytochrome b6-f complex iron-sulfur subunit